MARNTEGVADKDARRQATRHALAAEYLLHQAREAYIKAFDRLPDEDNTATKGFLSGYAYRLSLEAQERVASQPVDSTNPTQV